VSQEPENLEVVDRAVRLVQLMDLYGALLTDRQRKFMELHFEEDLSFGEIAREFEVSRQAVHDAVKHAEAALENYDAKLGLSPDQVRRPPCEEAAETVDASEAKNTSAVLPRISGLKPSLEKIEAVIDRVKRSGGVIYNAEGLARELEDILDQLRKLDEV
jgi:predicted DNA-binding protein YlxM (UPF0122 family)